MVRVKLIFFLVLGWSLKIIGMRNVIKVIGNIVLSVWKSNCFCIWIVKVRLEKLKFFWVFVVEVFDEVDNRFYLLLGL